MWISAREFQSIYKITGQTLHNWRQSGKAKYKRINDRKFLYWNETENENRINVIYARVSSSKQKEDLKRQKDVISEFMIKSGVRVDWIYEDIASGMNENRTGFSKLLDDVFSNKVKTVYISYKDRLTRFGFEYFKSIFSKFGTEIVVLNEFDSVDTSEQAELTQDLIAIIHHFSMKMYSSRRKELKKFKESLEKVT